MDLGLADRTYVVTGGSSGVGLATVRALLDEGANVATCGRDADRLKKLGTHERLFTATCDVRDADAVRGFVAASAQAFDGRIDGLVNNAGQSRMKRLDDTTEDDWRDELELKFAGVLNPLQAAREYLRASEAASVVNVNAVLAKQPEPRLITTSAARAGILNLSKSLSQELASDGIRVNSVCLGLIDTGQWTRRHAAADSGMSYEDWQAELAADRGVSLGRLGRAEEVAYAIVALLSPRASYITGTAIDVCGGVGRGIL
ncbi:MULTISPECIES: SDR family oxidoreductase [unclassified Streptomyces]|uniref:SDR family oxidoreductase n=1 Tax=unclassified Streptomyces TaxID=2593676 RepID=UPI002253D8A8|nr:MULTISPECIES: SDR family oxidoreductase [unclassified Streptomyces]MCX4833612.1 SDR family oxidoreductase [Streptomyces sp. NBC_01016]